MACSPTHASESANRWNSPTTLPNVSRNRSAGFMRSSRARRHHPPRRNRSARRVPITTSVGVDMDRNYHVFSNGRLERREDTLRLVTEDGENKPMPVENVEAVYLHGQVDFNTRLVGFLNDNGVAAHVFGWHDYYSGSEIGRASCRERVVMTVEEVEAEEKQRR